MLDVLIGFAFFAMAFGPAFVATFHSVRSPENEG
jgi:hypothetical protein